MTSAATNGPSEAALPLWRRLWIYQAERFPLGKTAVLLAAFSSASVNVSAMLAERPLPGWGAYAVAFLVSFILFVQLRVCDEVKDAETDARYRPERPIPRGLVGLRTVIAIGLLAMPVAVAATLLYHPALLALLALVWLWLALMSVEFFAPRWLNSRPVLYLVSHMAIMPLLDLFVTGTEWLPSREGPAAALAFFLGLSFVNGCILEVGRKLWAPENEREGVESYSKLWGIGPALRIWAGLCILSFGLLVAVGGALGMPLLFALLGAAALSAALAAAWWMDRARGPLAQARLDQVAGLWVFVCYMTSGFAPLLARWPW